MLIWGIGELIATHSEKGSSSKEKQQKVQAEKEWIHERKTEGQMQEKEGKGVPKFVSCLMITSKSTKEKSAEGKELSRISEGKSTELRT